MEGDFESEYPSIIIAFNISPETLNENPDKNTECYKCITNYGSGNAESSSYFLKETERLGIFPALCKNLLEKRRQCQKSDPTFKSLKLLLASIYGLIGTPRSAYYVEKCKRAVCSMGRVICDIAMHTLNRSNTLGPNQVVARFTDSC